MAEDKKPSELNDSDLHAVSGGVFVGGGVTHRPGAGGSTGTGTGGSTPGGANGVGDAVGQIFQRLDDLARRGARDGKL